MSLFRILVAFLFFQVSFVHFCHARIVSETWRFDGVPSQEDVSRWKKVVGKRVYYFKLVDLDSVGVARLLELVPTAILFQLEFELLPEDDAVYVGLRRLSSTGVPVDFIGSFGSLPTDARWNDLRSSGVHHYRFILDHYPFPFEAELLNAFPSGFLEVVFKTRSYPKYEEIELLRAFHPEVMMEFHQDYWPLYPQVDAMKLVPNPKVLHVREMVPAEPTFSYLKTMSSLLEIIADAMFFPSERSFWAQFGEMPLKWLHRETLQDVEGLSVFEATASLGPRVVLVDREEGLENQERSRYESSPLSVEIRIPAP